MAAYWIARAHIVDPVEYKKYTDLVPGILAKYNAKVLARGGEYKTLEGPENFERYIVLEFPSMADGLACFESEEYKTAAAFRRDGAGINELTLVSDGEPLRLSGEALYFQRHLAQVQLRHDESAAALR